MNTSMWTYEIKIFLSCTHVTLFVTAEKYINLLKEEGGLEILECVTRDPRPIDAIKQLAAQVINFVEMYQASPPEALGAEQMNGGVQNGEDLM